MVALKLGEEGFTKSHAESIYYLIYGRIYNDFVYGESDKNDKNKRLK